MPLMFLLSGYTMSLHPHFSGFSTFVRNRFMRLIVPYFLFEGCNLLVWSASLYFQGGWQDVTEAVRAILTCANTDGYTGYYGRLWFWPCMFVSDIFFYGIVKCAPRSQVLRRIYLFASIPVMLVCSWVTCRMIPGKLPFTVDTAFMATAFLLSGYLLGQPITWLIREKHLPADILILALSLLVMRQSVLTDQTMCMMFINVYGHYGYTLCAAYGGIVAFLILTKWFYGLCRSANFVKSFVLWYGYHSLCTFPIHLSIKMWIYYCFPLSCRRWYVILPAMLLFNTPLVNLITEYAPFMLGKISFPRKKHTSRI